jgi:hypothetical protein
MAAINHFCSRAPLPSCYSAVLATRPGIASLATVKAALSAVTKRAIWLLQS